MKTIPYTSLNAKNKARVDLAIAAFEVRPTIVHHNTIVTRSTKFVRSIVTVSNPADELNLVVGGKVRTTQVSLEPVEGDIHV